jgi:hypothetical protein
MTALPFSELDEQLTALTGRLTTLAAGEALSADIAAQIRAMDDVERRATGNWGRRSLQVRRAAIGLVALALEPGRGLTRYAGLMARGSNEVPARPQFIACFSTSNRGVVAVKSYGRPHPLEAAALADCAEAGVPGVIRLIDSGETTFGSWLELPFLANAQSLAEAFTPPPDAQHTHRYPDGRLTAVAGSTSRSTDRMHWNLPAGSQGCWRCSTRDPAPQPHLPPCWRDPPP